MADLPRVGLLRRKSDFITLADHARDARQWELATQLYRKALDRDPLNPPIWVQYGHSLKESGELRKPDRLAQAEVAYRRALSLDPGAADTYLQLGHVLKLQGKIEEARAAYLRAFALDPSASDPLSELRGVGWTERDLSELRTIAGPVDSETLHPRPPNGSDAVVRQGFGSVEPALAEALRRADAKLPSTPTPAESRQDEMLPGEIKGFHPHGEEPEPSTNRTAQLATGYGRITISLLTFSEFDSCLRLVSQLCIWLLEKINTLGLTITIIIRNNNPHLDLTVFDKQWKELIGNFPTIRLMLFNEGYNVGFGAGHNLNFSATSCDYLLILNDDIGFPHIDWLDEALAIFDHNPNVGAIGAANSPTSVTSFFGNGVFDRHGKRWPLRYAEASILIVRAKVFAEIGQFDKAYPWVMCEDSDLSFRIQAHGYDLEWIEIPHEHWRSSSINTLPPSMKSAILEHNRSVLFSKWNVALEENKIGRYEIFDVWSDGIGDTFCAFLHLRVYTMDLTDDQRDKVILNTSWPEVAKIIFGNHITIESIEDQCELRTKYIKEGVRSFKSTRGVNYGLPFNIHVLVCAALGIPVATHDEITDVLLQRSRVGNTALGPLTMASPYCVLHLESDRAGHDGRVPSPAVLQSIVTITADIFDRVVLVGKETLFRANDFAESKAEVIDLQGRLSIGSLIDVISDADAFVGIDSFPAHVAQVANVRSAVFFGSVHPAFRVLSERKTWPIVKPIDCIGCYHFSLEPGTPFCMRRDVSCTRDIDPDTLRAAISGCASNESSDWHQLATQTLELQRKFFMKMLFHPAPERRFFGAGSVSIGTASNLVYQIIDQVHDVVLSSGRVG